MGGRRKHACLKQASVNGKESSEYLHDLFHVGAKREPAGSEGHQHCPCQFGQQHQPVTGQHISTAPSSAGHKPCQAHPAGQEHSTQAPPTEMIQECLCADKDKPSPHARLIPEEDKTPQTHLPFSFQSLLETLSQQIAKEGQGMVEFHLLII